MFVIGYAKHFNYDKSGESIYWEKNYCYELYSFLSVLKGMSDYWSLKRLRLTTSKLEVLHKIYILKVM